MDGLVKVWDVQTGNLLVTMDGPQEILVFFFLFFFCGYCYKFFTTPIPISISIPISNFSG